MIHLDNLPGRASNSRPLRQRLLGMLRRVQPPGAGGAVGLHGAVQGQDARHGTARLGWENMIPLTGIYDYHKYELSILSIIHDMGKY